MNTSSSSTSPFDHQPRTRIVFAIDASARTGELARATGMNKVLVVTDPGVVAAGHAQRVLQSLDQAGVVTVLFDKARENPTTADVDACLAAARHAGIDGFIGLGGGSSMDTAKGCNFLLTNGGRMQDYRGVGKAARPMLPPFRPPPAPAASANPSPSSPTSRRTRKWPAATPKPPRASPFWTRR
jgi:alcohol dehydrogenase